MDFKQMILTEYLINNILNGFGESDFKLVFEMDKHIYTGSFWSKGENNQYTLTVYREDFGYMPESNLFHNENMQELRSAVFRKAFGESERVVNESFEHYTQNLRHLVFNDVVGVISETDYDKYFNDKVVFPETIFDLKRLDGNLELPNYLASDKTFNPVSFIEQAKSN